MSLPGLPRPAAAFGQVTDNVSQQPQVPHTSPGSRLGTHFLGSSSLTLALPTPCTDPAPNACLAAAGQGALRPSASQALCLISPHPRWSWGTVGRRVGREKPSGDTMSLACVAT